MPNNNTTPAVDLEDLEDDDVIEATDYAFIISADGELKSIVYPEDLMEDPPEEIQLILQVFGIDSVETSDTRTLH